MTLNYQDLQVLYRMLAEQMADICQLQTDNERLRTENQRLRMETTATLSVTTAPQDNGSSLVEKDA